MTAGPGETDSGLVARKGRACHICAASPDGPRYDSNQTEEQRKSIDNGVWLCANCSDLIDKNGGVDFDPADLRKWKKDHEKLIRAQILANRSSLALARKSTEEGHAAQSIVDFLGGKGAFYVHSNFENHVHIVRSLEEVRKELRMWLDRVEIDGDLYKSIKSLRETCQEYMNTTSLDSSPREIDASLAILRMKVGRALRSLRDNYGATIGGQLAAILPN